MPARYAIFYAPVPETPLWRFGRTWLGRCADRGEAVPQPSLGGIAPARLHAATAVSRLYGWHATLKPPFVLQADSTPESLMTAICDLAATCPAFDGPALSLQRLGDFLALVPDALAPRLAALAASCVESLDRFRTPPDAAELRRRRAPGLSPRQDALLARWGYPYVMEEYRFHMTLTGPLGDGAMTALEAALRPLVAPFAAMPLRVDQLAVFRQDAAGHPFTIVRRFPLATASISTSATKRSID